MKKVLAALMFVSVLALGCSGGGGGSLDVPAYEAPSNWGTASNAETLQSFRYPTDIYTTDLDFDTFETIVTRQSDGSEAFRVNLFEVNPSFVPSVAEGDIEMWDEVRGTASWL